MLEALHAIGVLVLVGVIIGVLVFLRNSWDEMKAHRAQQIDREPRRRWRYSGIVLGDRNFRSDGGCVLVDKLMTADEAITKCSELFPRGSVIYVDRENAIIHYQIAS